MLRCSKVLHELVVRQCELSTSVEAALPSTWCPLARHPLSIQQRPPTARFRLGMEHTHYTNDARPVIADWCTLQQANRHRIGTGDKSAVHSMHTRSLRCALLYVVLAHTHVRHPRITWCPQTVPRRPQACRHHRRPPPRPSTGAPAHEQSTPHLAGGEAVAPCAPAARRPYCR